MAFRHSLTKRQIAISLFLISGPGALLWLAVPTAAPAREINSAALLTDALPRKQTVKSASKAQLLGAICRATGWHRSAAAALTNFTVAARPELAGDIVATVLRCAGKVDCEAVGAIVNAASRAADENAATAIADAAIAKAPNCAETIAKAVRSSSKVETKASAAPAVPSLGGTATPEEEFDPHEALTLVCDDGMPRAVRKSQLEEFLRNHSDAFVGPCPPTPTPSSVAAPSPNK